MTYTWQNRLVTISIILPLLSGCATNIPVSNFCLIYEPVYTDQNDTEITKGQVDRNNAAYDCLCDGDIEICSKAGM
jgi:hypothetical protein